MLCNVPRTLVELSCVVSYHLLGVQTVVISSAKPDVCRMCSAIIMGVLQLTDC